MQTRLHPPPIMDMDGELTPELKSRVHEVELKNEEKKIEHEWEDNWNCCCISNRPTNSKLVKYLFQMAIIIAIISLCILRLSDRNLPCAVANTYVGLISLLIGIVLPSPSSSGKK